MKHMKQMAWAILVVGVLLAGTIVVADAAGGGGSGWHGGGSGWHTGGAGGGGGWHGGGWHGGTRVFIGGGIGWWGWPGWWGAPNPYYYPAPSVVAESAPSEYIQQAPAPPQQTYWYYCQNARAYYPYVQQCPGGWMQVVPQAAPPGP